MIYDRTKSFQGFRFLFIIGIAFMHAGFPFIGKGADLCSFFFVLSGFLYNVRNNKEPFNYIKKKFQSIYSTYWFCLIIYLILNISLGIWTPNLRFLPHFLLLQSFIPTKGMDFYFEYVGVSWFLSSLLFCYILSPLLSKMTQKMNPILGLSIAFSLIVMMYTMIKGDYRIWCIYISPIFRLCEYWMGMNLRIWVAEKSTKDSNVLLDIILLLGYFCILHYRVLGNISSLAHIVVIYYIFLHKSNLINVLMGNKFIINTSKYLIFVYLVHMIIFNALMYLNFPWSFIGIVFSILLGFFVGILYFKIRFLCQNS